MVAIRRPKAPTYSADLSVLALKDDEVKPTTSSKNMDSTKSFEGFEIKSDQAIRRQAKKSWFDLKDDASSAATTPFVTPSPFEGLSATPKFPTSNAEEFVEEEERVPSAEETVHATSSTTSTESFRKEEIAQPPAATSQYQQGFQHHNSQNAYNQYQQVQQPQQPQKANYELEGFVPFYAYDNMALNSDLPSKEMLGADPRQYPKLFFGHVWSKVPTGVIQWLLNNFAPQGSVAFGPQLHFNKEGWFRGCLHTSVVTTDAQSLTYTLHKRVLFDHTGVWFAETPEQKRMLDEYCRRLRSLPLQIRHNKLQSLPCNPLACELARNE